MLLDDLHLLVGISAEQIEETISRRRVDPQPSCRRAKRSGGTKQWHKTVAQNSGAQVAAAPTPLVVTRDGCSARVQARRSGRECRRHARL